jgi:hypothetical protein
MTARPTPPPIGEAETDSRQGSYVQARGPGRAQIDIVSTNLGLCSHRDVRSAQLPSNFKGLG